MINSEFLREPIRELTSIASSKMVSSIKLFIISSPSLDDNSPPIKFVIGLPLSFGLTSRELTLRVAGIILALKRTHINDQYITEIKIHLPEAHFKQKKK